MPPTAAAVMLQTYLCPLWTLAACVLPNPLCTRLMLRHKNYLLRKCKMDYQPRPPLNIFQHNRQQSFNNVQQHQYGWVPSSRGAGGTGHDGRGHGEPRVFSEERAAANAARHAEQYADNLYTFHPSFWAAVSRAVQNPAVGQEIRQDLERQERRAARARERRAERRRQRRAGESRHTQTADNPLPGRVRHGVPPSARKARNENPAQGSMSGDDDEEEDDGFEPTMRAEDLPRLYDLLSTTNNNNGFDNIRRTSSGVQTLGRLLEELDVEALWSARDVMIPFGTLVRILLRLFAGPYATDEENTIVRMLTLGVERASVNYEGFDDRRARRTVEPFAATYRRRGKVLHDLAAFRYMLQITEDMGRINRKHKIDLLLLYFTLTTPEVRLHRRWNQNDDEGGVLAFRDHITGFPIVSPTLMARPMAIEMHLNSVFGNVSANARLLNRSLSAALNNRNRGKTNGLNAAQEVEALMEGASLLDLSAGSAPVSIRPTIIENEHAALRHMLEMSVTVSMMAEEYRVFVAGAPLSRPSGGAPDKRSSSGGGSSECGAASATTAGDKRLNNRHLSRRPIFFTFKPTSQATLNT